MRFAKGEKRSGRPLFALATLAVGWTALRLALWDETVVPEPPMIAGQSPSDAVRETDRGTQSSRTFAASSTNPALAAANTRWTTSLERRWSAAIARTTALAQSRWPADRIAPAIFSGVQEAPPALPLNAPTSPFFTVAAGSAQTGPASVLPSRPLAAFDNERSRWSVDSWLLLRDGSQQSVAATGPSYGASQAGAVLRYRLPVGGAHRPAAYVRASRSLAGGPPDAELASGISARPLPGVPITVAAEARLRQVPGGSELRPAVLGWTELPPVQLGPSIRAEAYLQAGYVGGRDNTAFIDGQLRIDRRLARIPGTNGQVRAGAAAWSGAQEGAGRLDIGPSVSTQIDLGNGYARVSADWRFRVAGDATPQSGPAITVSAGF